MQPDQNKNVSYYGMTVLQQTRRLQTSIGARKRSRAMKDGGIMHPLVDNEEVPSQRNIRAKKARTVLECNKSYNEDKATTLDRPLGLQLAPIDSDTLEGDGEEERTKQERVVPHEPPRPEQGESPDKYLRRLVKSMLNIDVHVQPAASIKRLFPTPTEIQLSSYTADIVSAVRKNDVGQLQQLQREGKSLCGINQFGESLLHMACRRGFEDVVRCLLDQPDLRHVRIVDDCGRTPLHDCCWNPVPQLEICKWIIQREPALFFLADRRRFTPFDYARREHWDRWNEFLYENRNCFEQLSNLKEYDWLLSSP